MAYKTTFHITIVVAALFCTCSAVKVTIGNLGDKIDIIEGSETRMMCNIVRDSPTSTADPIIIWNNVTGGGEEKIVTFQSGSALFESGYIGRFEVDVNDGSLVISNTLRSYSGTYQCSVTILDDGSGDDDVVLDVLYLESPVLTFNTPVIEGDRVELTCSVVANPPPRITFKKDGASLQPDGQSTYTYQSVGRTNEGNYECEVSNSAGSESTASQMLEVYYAPEFEQLHNIEATPGDTVVINFNVEANPAAAYEWTTNPATTDIDTNLNTYTFVVSEPIDTVYSVTLNASNVVRATQETVDVTVIARTTTLMTTNAFTTLPTLPASCGALSMKVVEPDVPIDNDEFTVNIGTEVILDCVCESSNGFEYIWEFDDTRKSPNSQLKFTAEDGGHNVKCVSTAGAPNPSEVEVTVLVSKAGSVKDDGGIGTGAIVGIVIGIIAVLVILVVVIIIVLKSREDGPSNKSADSAYMDVTWDTKDPNRVNQGKKSGPPSNGTKQESSKLLESDTPKPSTSAEPDPYDQRYEHYGDERSYRTSTFGDDYNDKPDEDDYANSMPVTV